MFQNLIVEQFGSCLSPLPANLATPGGESKKRKKQRRQVNHLSRFSFDILLIFGFYLKQSTMFAKPFLFFFAALSVLTQCDAQNQKIKIKENKIKVKTASSPARSSSPILPAADQMEKYLPLLKGKRVALLVNQTSVVGKSHLIDTLLKAGVNIKVVFGPEHGFRGNASNGAVLV